jgi:hypothetical protein
MNPPTDEELRLILRDPENSFVERKVFSDSKDWLKTVVAFANSAPVDYPAVLFIGVKDDGTPEGETPNLDSIQKTFSEKVSMAYPTIYYETRILTVEEGRKVLAVVVPGSPSRPHFAGPSYVRQGSKSVRASAEQFDKLIAMRNSKVYKILEWKGKVVNFGNMRQGEASPSGYGAPVTVVDCNPFYVIVQQTGSSATFVVPLDIIQILFDYKSNRLELIRVMK